MVDLAEDQHPAAVDTEDRMITDAPSADEDQGYRHQTSLEDTIVAENPADSFRNVARDHPVHPDDASSTRPSLEHPGMDTPLSPPSSYQPRESSSFEAAAWTHLDLSWDEDEVGVTVEEEQQAVSRARLGDHTTSTTPLDEWVNTRMFGIQDGFDHHRGAIDQSNPSPYVHGSLGIPIPPTQASTNSGQRISRTIRNVHPGKDLRRTAHNMVEKRYRVNLNGKIAALRDSLPRFRARVARVSGTVDERITSNGNGGNTTTSPSSATSRVGKGEVLTDAVEYIRQLEGRIRSMAVENSALRARITALQEGGVMNGNGGGGHHSNVHQRGEMSSRMEDVSPSTSTEGAEIGTTTAPQDVGNARNNAPQGMIPVPENISRLRILTKPQPHYFPPFLIRRVNGGGGVGVGNGNGGGNGEKDMKGGGVHRMKVGSLADIL
ncbi:MAG: hypothetical protein M1823_005738 [Watsoniomyces obsoletus]|nr:MAG: hypothetical protein M1823_005738 [Watsoniomyces obsoletus]